MIDAEVHLLTVREYMSLDIEGKTKLIEGIIYDVSARNDPQRYALGRIATALNDGLTKGLYFVQQQDAVFIDGWEGKNAPEPDIAVVKLDSMAHPTAESTIAIVEVSDTTLRRDRRKAKLYGGAGIASWIVNINARCVEEYTQTSDLAIQYDQGATFYIRDIPIHVSSLFEAKA